MLTLIDTELNWQEVQGYLRGCSVKDQHLTAPPGGPVEGDMYWCGTGTGSWSTYTNKLMVYHAYTGCAIAWIAIPLPKGWPLWIEDENEFYVWTGAALVKLSTLMAATHAHYYERHTITAGDKAAGYIDLTVAQYVPGGTLVQTLKRTGEPEIPLTLTDHYTETSATRVTYVADVLEEGADIISRWQK